MRASSRRPATARSSTRSARYLEGHLGGLARAVDHGVPVRGNFAWCLLDNFEWAHGYGKRCGLIHVDFATQARTPKSSALWYRDFVAVQRR